MKTNLFLVLMATIPLQARMVKEVLIRSTEETANGLLFIHRVEVAEGMVVEQWSVNKAVVTEPDFEEALLEAEKTERKAERKAKAEQRKQEEHDLAQQQEFARRARLDICKKDLHLTLNQLEGELAKVRDSRLEPYYVFGEATFSSPESFKKLTDELMPQARGLVSSEKDCSEQEIKEMQAQLQEQPARVRELFRATVKQAINICNDTHLLRELLEIMA